jgi:hypothetical protein
MHTLLDMDTHADMPIRIRMGGTPLWCLNLALRVLMELESVVFSGSPPGGSTFVSISRVDSSRSGRSSRSRVSTRSMEEGQDRDAGRGKGGERVTDPISIIGGKM